MANNTSRIGISIEATNKAKGALKDVAKDASDAKKEIEKKSTFSVDTKSSESGLKNVKSAATGAGTAIDGAGKKASGASKNFNSAAGGARSLGSAASSTNVTMGNMNMNLAFAGQSLQQLTQMFGITSTATDIFSKALDEATKKESQMIQLSAKYGASASQITTDMEQIAAITPGDDSFLKTVLTQGAISGNASDFTTMKNEAMAIAGYLAGSSASGKLLAGSQRDIQNYLLNGETATMRIDSIYKDHIDDLNQAKTIQERIAVIQKLNAEHYNDILATAPTLDNMMQLIEGKLNVAYMELGNMILPVVKQMVVALLQVNDATDGWVIKGGIIAAAAIGLGVSLVTLIGILEFLGITYAATTTAELAFNGATVAGFGIVKGGAVQSLIAMAQAVLGLGAAEGVATASIVGNTSAILWNTTGKEANIVATNASLAATIRQTAANMANSVSVWAQETAYILRNVGLAAYLGLSGASIAATIKDTVVAGASAAASLVAGAAKLTWAAAAGVLTVALGVLEAVGAPILILVAALAAAVYVASSSFRDGAATMAAYNNELENGDTKISKLRESSNYYANQVTELTAKRNEMAAAGQDTAAIEAEIADAQSKSASTAQQAADGELALQNARAKKDEITKQAAANEADYAQKIKETLAAAGATPEQTSQVDTSALDAGTRQQEYGLAQQKRIQEEALRFTDSIMNGSNQQADAWKKDTEALSEYATGMGKLSQLEIDYNNAEGWGEKMGILWEQFTTKAQVDWINAMIVLGDWWNWFTGPIQGALDWLGGAWDNTLKYLQESWINAENIIQGSIDGFGAWIQGFVDRLGELWDETVQYFIDKWDELKAWVEQGIQSVLDIGYGIIAWVRQKWDELKAWIQQGIQTVLNIGYGMIAWVRQKWDELKSWVQRGIQTAIDIGTGAIDWAKKKFNDLKNWIESNPIVQYIRTVTEGGATAVQTATNWVTNGINWIRNAFGPGEDPVSDGISTSYESYGGYTGRPAWSSDGGCLTGNCVDMSVGLVQRYGGSLVNGTWNGNPHVWWKSPAGKEYDPAHKAINGSWNPPAAGPTRTQGGMAFNFYADVYGFDDFAAQVEKATGQNIRRSI